MKQKIAVYPGTFDPITNGHFDVIERAGKLFDRIIIAVAKSTQKSPMFDLDTRVFMAEQAVKGFQNVEVRSFGNLLADFAKECDANIVVRGLRAVSDFEYELQMGYANASLNPNLETIYLMPSLSNAFISATVVRTIIYHKGDFSHLVPEVVQKIVKEKFCMSR